MISFFSNHLFHHSKFFAIPLCFPSPMVIISQVSMQISILLLLLGSFFLWFHFFLQKSCFTSHRSKSSTSSPHDIPFSRRNLITLITRTAWLQCETRLGILSNSTLGILSLRRERSPQKLDQILSSLCNPATSFISAVEEFFLPLIGYFSSFTFL